MNTFRRNLYRFLETDDTRSGKYFGIGIQILIVLNILAGILETEQHLPASIRELLFTFEVVSVIVFTVEYLLRIYAIVEDPRYSKPISGRLRFAFTPLALVDLLAVAPFYMPFIHADLRFARILRLLRFFRILKLARYNDSIRNIAKVIQLKREELAISLFAVLLLLLMASSMMYYIENEAQPDAFASITSSLWWGVATLTTVGYGDIYPITPMGKFLGAIIQILGIGMFALPAGILSSGFSEVILESRKKEKMCPHCGETLVE